MIESFFKTIPSNWKYQEKSLVLKYYIKDLYSLKLVKKSCIQFIKIVYKNKTKQVIQV